MHVEITSDFRHAARKNRSDCQHVGDCRNGYLRAVVEFIGKSRAHAPNRRMAVRWEGAIGSRLNGQLTLVQPVEFLSVVFLALVLQPVEFPDPLSVVDLSYRVSIRNSRDAYPTRKSHQSSVRSNAW